MIIKYSYIDIYLQYISRMCQLWNKFKNACRNLCIIAGNKNATKVRLSAHMSVVGNLCRTV